MYDGGFPEYKETNVNIFMCVMLLFAISCAMSVFVTAPKNISKNESTMTGNKIYKKCINSVTQIDVYMDGQKENSGTGTIWNKDETTIYIMTNYHVVNDEAGINYTFDIIFNNKEKAPASLKSISKENDIALLTVSKKDISENLYKNVIPIEKGDSETALEGNKTWVIGNALGYGQSITEGIISARNRSVNLGLSVMNFIQTTAPVNDGNSGGVLLDERGLMIGMITGKMEENTTDGMAFAIPINKIKEVEKNLKEPENKEEPGITNGMILEDVSDDQKKNGIPSGIYVRNITEDNKLYSLGIRKDDIITAINSKQIEEVKMFTKMIKVQDSSYTINISRYTEASKSYETIKISVD